jgi:Protein of unknown function DUF262/Protein of unknown function (DUF1524)
VGKITADSRTVDELLSRRYEVDYYQREYRWGIEHVAQLLDDLVAKFQDSFEPGHEQQKVAAYDHYFLGSIVLAERDGEFFIVDGQQRLTTLTLLLTYLQGRQPERGDIRPLIFSEKFGEKRFNLNVPEREAAMRAVFDGEPYDPSAENDPSARNMWDRFQDIHSLFAIEEKQPDESEPIAHLTDWLLHKVILVEIIASDEEAAYTIFETMNDRGLSLSEAEMLKGYLLSQFDDDAKRDQANDLWRARMVELIERSRDDELDFFKAWLRGRHAETIRERKKGAVNRDFDHIGTQFHKWVREQAASLGLENASEFSEFVLRDFDAYSRRYLRARSWAETLTEPYEAVFFNARNNFTLQYPLLMAPITPEDTTETANEKMRLVGNYLDIYVARRIVNYKSLGYSSIVYTMFQFMREIREREDVSRLSDFLRTRLEELPEQFDDGSFGQFGRHQQNQRFVFHLLARMTYFVERMSAKPTSFQKYLDRSASGRYDIEHVWPGTLDDYVESYPDRFKTREQADQFRNRLGGLVLLPEKVNRSLQAKAFPDKQNKYLEDNLLAGSLHPGAYTNNPGFTNWIAEAGLPFTAYDEFTAEAIENRQALYAQLCRLVWSPDRLLPSES